MPPVSRPPLAEVDIVDRRGVAHEDRDGPPRARARRPPDPHRAVDARRRQGGAVGGDGEVGHLPGVPSADREQPRRR